MKLTRNRINIIVASIALVAGGIFFIPDKAPPTTGEIAVRSVDLDLLGVRDAYVEVDETAAYINTQGARLFGAFQPNTQNATGFSPIPSMQRLIDSGLMANFKVDDGVGVDSATEHPLMRLMSGCMTQSAPGYTSSYPECARAYVYSDAEMTQMFQLANYMGWGMLMTPLFNSASKPIYTRAGFNVVQAGGVATPVFNSVAKQALHWDGSSLVPQFVDNGGEGTKFSGCTSLTNSGKLLLSTTYSINCGENLYGKPVLDDTGWTPYEQLSREKARSLIDLAASVFPDRSYYKDWGIINEDACNDVGCGASPLTTVLAFDAVYDEWQRRGWPVAELRFHIFEEPNMLGKCSQNTSLYQYKEFMKELDKYLTVPGRTRTWLPYEYKHHWYVYHIGDPYSTSPENMLKWTGQGINKSRINYAYTSGLEVVSYMNTLPRFASTKVGNGEYSVSTTAFSQAAKYQKAWAGMPLYIDNIMYSASLLSDTGSFQYFALVNKDAIQTQMYVHDAVSPSKWQIMPTGFAQGFMIKNASNNILPLPTVTHGSALDLTDFTAYAFGGKAGENLKVLVLNKTAGVHATQGPVTVTIEANVVVPEILSIKTIGPSSGDYWGSECSVVGGIENPLTSTYTISPTLVGAKYLAVFVLPANTIAMVEFIGDSSSQPTPAPTNTMLPVVPTNTPIATNTPTWTPLPRPTATATATATATPIPPTATATSTGTIVPPTATNTPTATKTATATPTKTNTPVGSYSTTIQLWSYNTSNAWASGRLAAALYNCTTGLSVYASGDVSRTASRYVITRILPVGTYHLVVMPERQLASHHYFTVSSTATYFYFTPNGVYGNANWPLDSTVDILDFSILSAGYGCYTGDACYTTWKQADFNWDGAINMLDYAILSTYFGSTSTLSGVCTY